MRSRPGSRSMAATPLPTARRRPPNSPAPVRPIPAASPISSSATRDLKQVVSRTFEAGLRGSLPVFEKGRLRYSLALYRSDLDDDIAFINSPVQGRAFFANIGSTRRQGLDAELRLTTDRWLAYINYSFIDATFQNTFVEASGNNPAADLNGNITVQPGSRLPSIPAHQLKVGAYYKVTDKWTLGANLVASSSVYLVGDEANLTAPLPPYATLDLTTSYRPLPNVRSLPGHAM